MHHANTKNMKQINRHYNKQLGVMVIR